MAAGSDVDAKRSQRRTHCGQSIRKPPSIAWPIRRACRLGRNASREAIKQLFYGPVPVARTIFHKVDDLGRHQITFDDCRHGLGTVAVKSFEEGSGSPRQCRLSGNHKPREISHSGSRGWHLVEPLETS